MSYGVPFPGSQPQYSNPNAAYAGGHMGGMPPVGAMPSSMGAMPGSMGAMPGLMPPTAAAADPYANAQPGTIAYAKSEGPDGIATYTPVIAQETFYQTPAGPTRGIKWVTATTSQASAAGIPPGAITASSPAQLPANARAMPAMTFPPGGELPGGYAAATAATPSDDYPVLRPGMSQREHDKLVRKWEKEKEKERRAAEKRARKEDKDRKRDRERDRGGDRGDRDRWDTQDPYDIAGGRGADRPRRMSAGASLGFERARRISGGAGLRDDELTRKLESLNTDFSARRERRMSGGGGPGYAPSAAGGYTRSRKGSMSEAGRDRKISGGYELPRPNFYTASGPAPGGYGGYGGGRSVPGSPVRSHSAFAPASHYDDVVPHGGPSPRPGHYNRSRHPSPSMPPAHLPGGYGGTYGGARDPTAASAYSYGAERTPFSTTSALPGGGDSYALTRRPAGGAPSSMYPVSGRELNRAQPFTAFEEFFLVEDLRELMQPQPPPLPAALVPHDVMAEEWDRCMQGLIQLAGQAVQSGRSSALEPLMDLITQWNTAFFLPRGVDISVYKGNSRRSGPPVNIPSAIRTYDESESESETSSSSSSTSTSDSDDDRSYYSSTRRDQKSAKKAERKARRKDRARRRRARRRQRTVSIRIRAVPLH